MSDIFVVDASVGFAWIYPSQASRETDRLLDRVIAGATVVVPSLWFLEVANGLLAAQRRKLLTRHERRNGLDYLSALPFSVDEDSGRAAFRKTSELAEKHGLSIYDAVYLETALRRRLLLGTRDAALRRAAKRSGANLLD